MTFPRWMGPKTHDECPTMVMAGRRLPKCRKNRDFIQSRSDSEPSDEQARTSSGPSFMRSPTWDQSHPVLRDLRRIVLMILLPFFYPGAMAEPRKLSPAPPGPLSIQEISVKLGDFLKSGHLNPRSIENMFESPLEFVYFQQHSNGARIHSKSRLYSAPGRYGPVPFTALWYTEKISDKATASLAVKLNDSSICLTKASISEILGQPDAVTRVLPEFSSDPTVRVIEYLKYERTPDFKIRFEFEKPCARAVVVQWENADAWTKNPEKISAGAEFVNNLVPFRSDGTQLAQIGLTCRADGSALSFDSSSKICFCDRAVVKENIDSHCNYTVRYSNSSNENILLHVKPRDRPD